MTAFFVASCGTAETAAHVRRVGTTSTSHAGGNGTVKTPVVIAAYVLTEMPTGFSQLRKFEVLDPDGATAHIRWFSASGNGPTLTTNLTAGTGVGLRALDMARSRANEMLAESRRSGVSIPTPVDITINGNLGIAYSDPLGWRSLLWVVGDDAVMSVTGLKFSDAILRKVAQGVQFS